jgi:Flp pilus assembly protein CpaB
MAAALACALLAALLASRQRSAAEAGYGPLRPVLVAAAELGAGKPIEPEEARRALVTRRVPARFVPPGALRRPEEALGQAPAVTIPAGSYVIAAQLSVPLPDAPGGAALGGGRRPVQVAVTGAEALLVGGGAPEGQLVDVIVARQSGLGQGGGAEIAAEGVELLALNGPKDPGEGWTATLAVDRDQALDLIEAEANTRQIRLLPRP